MKIYSYTTKRHKKPIVLSSNHLLLIKLIGNFGFVNTSQLNILWSVVQRYPNTLSRTILKEWCSYGGLLKYVPKSHAKRINHGYYFLTQSAKKWLSQLGLLEHSQENINVNSHNEQAIESLIQGLYTASFKSEELGFFHPYLIYKDHFYHSPYSSNKIYKVKLTKDFEFPEISCTYKINITKNMQDKYLNEIINLLSKDGMPILNMDTLFKVTRYLRSGLIKGFINPDQLEASLHNHSLSIKRIHSQKNTIIFPLSSKKDSYFVPKDSTLNFHITFVLNRLHPTYKLFPSNSIINLKNTMAYFSTSVDLKRIQNYPLMGQNNKVNNLQSNLQTLLGNFNSKTSKQFITYYYPQANIHIETSITSATDIDWLLLAIANLYIEKDVLDNFKKSADSKKHPLNLSYRHRSSQLERGIDLISTPGFNLQDYDFRTFNQQFGIKFASENKLPFVSDMMVSFKRNNKPYELFIELDNRTEGNKTQVQKVLNYIWYARNHPSHNISLFISLTDGSLDSPKIPSYSNIGRKLGNLATKLVNTYLPNGGQKLYLSKLYQNTPNLNIYLAGVSEIHYDIAQVLLGGNFLSDYLYQTKKLTKYLQTHINSNITLKPNKYINQLQHNPISLLENISSTQPIPLSEKLHYSSEFKKEDVTQTIYFCLEHELNSIFNMYNSIHKLQDIDSKRITSSLNIYPTRSSKLTAITLPQYKNNLNYPSTKFVPTCFYLYQPLIAKDNIQTNKECRWLLYQYKNFVLKHLLSKDTYSLISSVKEKETYLNTIKLDDVSSKIYVNLIDKLPSGIYSLPIFSLPHYLDVFSKNYNMSVYNQDVFSKNYNMSVYNQTENLKDYIYELNSTFPFARSTVEF